MRSGYMPASRTAPLASLIFIAACSGPVESNSRAADEAAIREADAGALRAIAAKQTEAIAPYYDERASILIPNAPMVTGREQIRKAWDRMFATHGFTLAPKTNSIEVARSGDLAYSQGTYEFAASDPKGNSVNDRGKFIVVWRKQSDGAWKIVADIWNSDLPLTAASKP